MKIQHRIEAIPADVLGGAKDTSYTIVEVSIENGEEVCWVPLPGRSTYVTKLEAQKALENYLHAKGGGD